ncbi:MAG: lipocalin family protein [Pseudobacteriovorax sp.]|nr:lipocalin family protein [Pseudobacteriovorax sp.]
MKSFISTALVSCTIFAGSVSANTPEENLVEFVDVPRYAGLWYEIASIPQFFSFACRNTTAEYTVINETQIGIFNKCSVAGLFDIDIEGTGTVVDTTSNAFLEIDFDRFSGLGEYLIIDLAEDYSYALVTDTNADSLFVLSREKTLDADIYEELLAKGASVGADISRVRLTRQD